MNIVLKSVRRLAIVRATLRTDLFNTYRFLFCSKHNKFYEDCFQKCMIYDHLICRFQVFFTFFVFFFSFPFVNFCLITWTLALVSSNNKFRWVLLAHCFHILSLSALFLDLENTVFNEISHFPNNPGNHDEPQKPLSMERERGN